MRAFYHRLRRDVQFTQILVIHFLFYILPHGLKLPDRARKGRSAVSSRAGRFEANSFEAVDDGWTEVEELEQELDDPDGRHRSKSHLPQPVA